MEPLSLAVGLIPLIKLASTVGTYLRDFKNATKEYGDMAGELMILQLVLEKLEKLVSDESHEDAVISPGSPFSELKGPIKRLEDTLKLLESKLCSVSKYKDPWERLTWHFDKKEFEQARKVISYTQDSITALLVSGIAGQVRKGHSEVMSKLDSLKDTQDRDERKQLLDWLSPADFTLRQREIFSKRCPGTGNWFLDTKDYQAWREGTGPNTLFCPGIPGAGKTIISSLVVDDLRRWRKRDDSVVVCLYCTYGEKNEQSSQSFLANIIKQTLQSKPTLRAPQEILQYQERRPTSPPTFKELATPFRSLASQLAPVIIIIDALDETDENSSIRRELLDLLGELDVKLFVTSRDIQAIRQRFERVPNIEIKARETDVQQYVLDRIERTPSLNCFVEPRSDLERMILERVVSETHGMFLLAKFHVDALDNQTRPIELKRALQALPLSIFECYNNIWDRIQRQPKPKAKLASDVLLWLGCVFRPLNIRALQHALAIMPDIPSIQADAVPGVDMILSVCAGLVSVQKETGTIQLVHYTAKEWLDRSRDDLFPDSRSFMVQKCMKYLSFDIKDTRKHWTDEQLRTCPHPLLPYAAVYWAEHARGCFESEHTEDIVGFLRQPRPLKRMIQVKYKWREYHEGAEGAILREKVSYSNGTLGFLIAAAEGFQHVLTAMLDSEQSVNISQRHAATALFFAITRDDNNMVNMLIARTGVDVNWLSKTNDLALQLAAAIGSTEMVETLINNSANVNMQCGTGTALHTAVTNDDTGVAQVLIRHGADINSKILSRKFPDEHMSTPMFTVCNIGPSSDDMRELMLSSGADMHARDAKSWTLLHAAAWKADFKSLKWLIKNSNIDLEARDSKGRTPLHMTWGRTNNYCVEVLLDSGVNVDTKDDDGRTALAIAVKKARWRPISPVLFQYGAKFDTFIQKHPYLLHTSINKLIELSHGETNTVTIMSNNIRLCVKFGLNPHSVDRSGRSLLWYAARLESLELVKTLHQEFHLDIHLADINSITPLQRACQLSSLEVLHYLVDNGVDTRVVEKRGCSLLDLAHEAWDKTKDARKRPDSRRLEQLDNISKYLESLGIPSTKHTTWQEIEAWQALGSMTALTSDPHSPVNLTKEVSLAMEPSQEASPASSDLTSTSIKATGS
ncbi:uncharacterized protein KY384_000509 [Bacidia gigantensis]|uniref:uncharacterized protein n=1 Tax=Bacidia gigantensis TaxID=2732470 RepID=UPI001D05B8F3|nr:uncharacterized protein KY384_000509 [Bacidia gigantensis]KAG8525749.1 hypothetical protein KY384_000509 [Bacidia gigantensis]